MNRVFVALRSLQPGFRYKMQHGKAAIFYVSCFTKATAENRKPPAKLQSRRE